MSSINQLNVQSVLGPIKRQKIGSANLADLDTAVCYMAGQCSEQSCMDTDNPQRSFQQRHKHCTTDGVQYPEFTENTMYCDTASLCHLTNDDTDM